MRSLQNPVFPHLGRTVLHHVAAKVKVQISHHSLLENGDLKQSKALVFVLDMPSEDAPGKKRKATITAKNFGAHVNISRLKANGDNLMIVWRCRQGRSLFLSHESCD